MLMRRLFAIGLVLALGLASIGSALTHAQRIGAYETLLCADGGMRTALISAQGEEIAQHYNCPDCVLLALMTAKGQGLRFSKVARRARFERNFAAQSGRLIRPRGARDPPKV